MMHRRDTRNGRRPAYRGAETRDGTEADFLADVTAVGAEPTHVSGIVPAYQTLTVAVTEVLRGDVEVGSEIDVDVLVVAGNPHVATGAAGLPALDVDMVQPGVSVHVWADFEHGRWRAVEIGTDGPQDGSAYYAGGR